LARLGIARRVGIERAEGELKQVARELIAARGEPLPALRGHPFPSGEGDARYRHRSNLEAQSHELTSLELEPAFPFSIRTRPRDARAGKLETQSFRAHELSACPSPRLSSRDPHHPRPHHPLLPPRTL